MGTSDGGAGQSTNDALTRLSESLSVPELRRNYIEMLMLGSLLQGSVIDYSYTLPDTMVAPIQLTELGSEVFAKVRTERPKLKPNDIKFGIFLEFGCPGGVLVEPTTDITALRGALSVEILKQKVLFPYIFGRELHDAAAAAHPEKNELTPAQSVALLKSLPVGVFQQGYTTTGPFGCIEADTPRLLESRITVPGYCCSDATCNEPHPLHLNTSNAPPRISPANKARQYVGDLLKRQYSSAEDPHARLIGEAGAVQMGAFAVSAPEAYIEAVADGLDPGELRHVVDGILRRALREYGAKAVSRRLSAVIHSPSKFVNQLSVPHLIQLTLIFREEFLIESVDECVRRNLISLGPHEVRTRKLDRFRSGQVLGEIGKRGMRLTGGGRFVASRLMEMLDLIYYGDSGLRPEDLAYLIGGEFSEAEPTHLLEQAVRDLPAHEILRVLVLGSRQAHDVANSYLNIEEPVKDKGEQLQTLLWKLGAASDTSFGDLERVFRFETELAAATESATQDEVRGHISNLFAALESGLRTSLEFVVWALTNDHFLDRHGFSYDPSPRPSLLAYIEEYAPTADARLRLDVTSGKNSLSPIGGGFSRLAKALEASDRTTSLRPIDQVPIDCRESSRPFAFPYTLPFQNLTARSRGDVLEALQSVSRLIQDAVVLKVRNAPLHGAQDFPSAGELRLAIEKVAELRCTLVKTGLYPCLYTMREASTDALGRTIRRYEGQGVGLTLYGPTRELAPRLPTARQIIAMPVCALAGSGPLRFVVRSRPGGDPYWNGWPKRWSVAQSYAVASHDQSRGAIADSAIG